MGLEPTSAGATIQCVKASKTRINTKNSKVQTTARKTPQKVQMIQKTADFYLKVYKKESKTLETFSHGAIL